MIRVVFDLQKKTDSLAELPGLSIESLDVGTGTAKFDLVLAMENTGSELRGVLDYDNEKFEAETARQLARHFVALMKSASAQPDIPASRLPMMDFEELARLQARGSDTSNQAHGWPFLEVNAQARQRPEALALADGGARWSYGELHACASRVAAFLRRQNVGRGQHVALFLHGGPDLVIAELAVMMSGAAFVPIDPAYPASRVALMIRDCEAVLVLTNAKSPDIHPCSARVVYLDRDCAATDGGDFLEPPPASLDSDPAYVIYTSGSTGHPKGVLVSHAALANFVAWHRRVFKISNNDRATQLASVAFDASIMEIWPHLAAGASVHFPPREFVADPAGLRDWLVKNQITVCFVPTLLRRR